MCRLVAAGAAAAAAPVGWTCAYAGGCGCTEVEVGGPPPKRSSMAEKPAAPPDPPETPGAPIAIPPDGLPPLVKGAADVSNDSPANAPPAPVIPPAVEETAAAAVSGVGDADRPWGTAVCVFDTSSPAEVETVENRESRSSSVTPPAPPPT